jgi:hypothetical protein
VLVASTRFDADASAARAALTEALAALSPLREALARPSPEPPAED